jgi:hypothetical protein
MAKQKTFQYRMGYRAQLMAETGLGNDSIETNILGQLTQGTYFFKPFGSGRVLYNIDLIRDYLVNGDSPAHQKAVKRWLSSLPSSDVA